MENNNYQNDCNQQGNYNQYGSYNQPGGNGFLPHLPIHKRNIVLCIILTLITCGLYGIYWIVVINDEINCLAGESNDTSGGMVILYTFITCGIYGIFWLYKMGNKVDKINGKINGNSGLMYIILAFLGLSIISHAIMQDVINNYARRMY
ncbi:MAG: DUF4234 domain-containing protein [Eubacterium sp.]|nr:DUF4234 domain-containing protein [Eubacterium sp.]